MLTGSPTLISRFSLFLKARPVLINFAFSGFPLTLYFMLWELKCCSPLKMKGLDKWEGSCLSDTLCWHLSLFCHQDKLLVLWLLVRIGVGTELTEAVEDNVVLMFGGGPDSRKELTSPLTHHLGFILPERSFIVKDRKSKSVEDRWGVKLKPWRTLSAAGTFG